MEQKTLCTDIGPAALLEDAGIGILTLDRNLRVTSANLPAAGFLQKAPEALSGTTLEDDLPSPMYTRLSEAAAAALAGNSPADAELFLPAGSGVWLSCRCRPHPGGLILILTDITVLRRTEQALQDSEERFRAIRDATFGGLAVHDKGVILECNKGLSDMTGFSREELIGMKNLELAAPEWREHVMQKILSGYPETYDIVAVRRDGSRFPAELRGRNMPFRGRTMRVTEFRDITERKRSEEERKRLIGELESERAKLAAILEQMPSGVSIAEAPSGRLIYQNEAALKLMGHNIREGEDYHVLARYGALHADGTPYRPEEYPLFRALQGEHISLEEMIYRRGDGTRTIFSVNSTPIRDGQGNIISAVSTFNDISARKRMDENLRESEERYRRLNERLEHKVLARTRDLEDAAALLEEQKELLQAIIDNIPVMIALLDPSGRVTLINREYERITGWSLEEARRMDILAATHPDPRERQRAIQAVQKSEPGWIDFDIHTRSGMVLSTSWANVRFSDGSAMGIGIDISARRKMERDLLLLATAVEQSGEGIIVARDDGVLEYANPAFENISGYSRDELVGVNPSTIEEYFAGYRLQDIIACTMKEGKTWSGRQQRRRKNGEAIEVNLSVSPIRDVTGRITSIVSVVRDVTQETRLQKQLSMSQRMEAIGSLAGGIAHDLKNILTPILINTELALEDVGEESPSHPVLGEVLEAARLGRDLVQQILTFSRRAPQKKCAVNLVSVIRETLSFLRSSLPTTIEIRGEMKDACVMTFVDPTQIKQVLINLGSNAGYAMREKGGTLQVGETRAFLDEEAAVQVSPDLKAGSYVQVSVRDTGYGMDEETMEHIFEPFFTTKKGEGTGMGLAVAHGIIKEHQGAISVKSLPGQGTTFTILLPELTAKKEEDMECEEPIAS